MTVLSVQNLGAMLGGRAVLNDISFEAGRGELIGLIGPNGAGKTTLLRSILGLAPAKGKIAFDGRDMAALRRTEKAALIAYLPQERDVAWPITVEMLVSLGRRALKAAFVGLNAHDAAKIQAAMEQMDIVGFRDRPADALSGGERARALIARVLAQDTPLILADEPVAGLDPAHQLGLMESLAAEARDGRTIIVSLHDLGLAAQYCTRLILMDRGQVVADGVPETVLTQQRLSDVYGIEAHILRLEGQFLILPKARIQR
ncbi:ABC transporter ATP-binding protein [Daeguia caeni]|uniref:ABC transporter ATP-binding protein n=1 Tax=Daeguia caeni TaxID=439612 RepID=A0ABV9H4N3_9HYPH